MANGNKVTFKWIAGGMAVIILAVVAYVWGVTVDANTTDIRNLQNQIAQNEQLTDYDVDSVKDDLNDIKVDVKALSVKQTHMHDEIKELKDMVRQLANP